MKVVDAVFEMVAKEGINHLFCVPGMPVDGFMESLSSNEEIHTIVAAHECGAAYMADGYSRASGRFGVCMAISGPGLTNMVTGLATASADGSALLAIIGEIRNDWVARGAFQDTWVEGLRGGDISLPVTRQHLTINHPQQTWQHLQTLAHTMLSHSTRGPVHLSVPTNIQRSEVDGEWQPLPDSLYRPRFIDRQSCDSFWSTLGDHSRVAILAGSGCVHSEASSSLIRFAERFHIPVATTFAAKGVFPEDHPLSLGVLGWFGHRPAINALTEGSLDVLIVVGSRLNMLSTLVWHPGFQPKHALIVNDINSHALFRNYSVDLAIQGDAQTFLDTLNNTSVEQSQKLEHGIVKRKEWLANLKQGTYSYYESPENRESSQLPIHPARAINDLQKAMPDNTMLFTDSGAHAFFAGHYWLANQPRHCFTAIKYMGSMGWAIPAAIGAMFARPDTPCVVITGDGCMLMHGIEIQTAARYGVPLICVVMNNSALGNPKFRADKFSPAMSRLLELPTHDWAAFARSLGAEGITVNQVEELLPAFKKALEMNKAIVIDVRVGNYPTPTGSFDKSGSQK